MDKFDENISIAIGFAEVFAKQRGDISDSIFQLLEDTFTDEEISELCAFVAFTSACHDFGEMMKLEPERKY
ncbi:hypothetical protein LC087_13415 [Bacillus carboniphilus]|uniref:Alkylhydroperoxidase n=1 Tax=Bacillus carboniphilus TaxID=86663 RepID=A0ABY9JSP1_9BACI|nr:hypothetical protein [Bacillus carboniphilus]WLR41834.1 hypothetical protein LC087_13415 [Bacillus carboniphilus]